MDKPILFVKNITHEGPGLMENILKERGLRYEIVDLNQGEHFPDPTNYHAIIVLGGPDSANDTTAKMLQELEQITKIIKLGIPYLGICLGLQTLVKAAGGSVLKNPVPEIGFRNPDNDFFKIALTAEGQTDPLYAGLSPVQTVFQLHGETVEPTDQMTVLATGKFCTHQALRVGENAYGLQYHFELTPAMFREWFEKDPDLAALDQTELNQDFDAICADYTKNGIRLCENFLKIAKV